jgi:hypothetical protein
MGSFFSAIAVRGDGVLLFSRRCEGAGVLLCSHGCEGGWGSSFQPQLGHVGFHSRLALHFDMLHCSAKISKQS